MEMQLEEKLSYVRQVLEKANIYHHAAGLIGFDQETDCPPMAMESQGEVKAFLGTEAFRLIKDEAFIEAAEYLYGRRQELDEFDKVLIEGLHRTYLKTKNITPEQQHEFALVYNRAFVNWSKAREASDFALFAPALEDMVEISRKEVSLREKDPESSDHIRTDYDHLLDDYERGICSDSLDESFGRCIDRLVPLLKKITASKKQIRTDFLSRPVEDEAQRKMARYLLETMKFDFNRGKFTTSEHPFTSNIAKNDTRLTTHFYPEFFCSSIYSIVHEGGHALFEQLQPEENFEHFIDGTKTLGMHESVSRFYENRIGRSEAFIHLIYPKLCEIFPDVMKDVSEKEMYEAVNIVTPSLIRTEADEFTYTFHVIIRYEIEKEIIAGNVKVSEIPELWKKKYMEYLGVAPSNDREGVLQDVHWTFGFGYFPTYAIGNMYNAMYYNRMKQELDIDAAVSKGDFDSVNGWMKEHVFKKADRLMPADWIKDITGRDFTPDDFLDYLEEKYGRIYEL